MQLVKLDGRPGKVRFVYDTPQGEMAVVRFDDEPFYGESFEAAKLKVVPLRDLESVPPTRKAG